MKPFILDGVIYNKEWVEGLQQSLLAVRDALIVTNHLDYAASLSEIHAVLDYYIKQLDLCPTKT